MEPAQDSLTSHKDLTVNFKGKRIQLHYSQPPLTMVQTSFHRKVAKLFNCTYGRKLTRKKFELNKLMEKLKYFLYNPKFGQYERSAQKYYYNWNKIMKMGIQFMNVLKKFIDVLYFTAVKESQ